MSENSSVKIIAQYVTKAWATSHIKPYQNRSALTNGIDGSLRIEPLPEANHWRVVVELIASGTNQEQVLCFDTGCEAEAIAFIPSSDEVAQRQLLLHVVGAFLIGTIRTQISSVVSATGYGPVTLPPFPADRIEALIKE